MSKKISRRNRRIRNLLLVISMMMVVAMASVGVTVAWLTAETVPVVNTFTASDINITLGETTGTEYKMVPGNEIAKDPKVTIKAGSEACYVFVKIDKSTAYNTYMEDYKVAAGWTRLTGAQSTNNSDSEVYYRLQTDLSATGSEDASYYVLEGTTANANGSVKVKEDVTKSLMNALSAENAVQPTLTFTAYACQSANFDDNPEGAWNAAKPVANGN